MLSKKITQRFLIATRSLLRGENDPNALNTWHSIVYHYNSSPENIEALRAIIQRVRAEIAFIPLYSLLLDAHWYYCHYRTGNISSHEANVLAVSLLYCSESTLTAPAFQAQAHYIHGLILTDTGSFERGLSKLQQADTLNHANAPIRLAQLLGSSEYAKIIPLLEKAIARNNGYAMYRRATMHLLGEGGEKNIEAGIKLLDRAIQLDEPLAMYQRALLYAENLDDPSSGINAILLFEDALTSAPYAFWNFKEKIESCVKSILEKIGLPMLVSLLLPRLRANEPLSEVSLKQLTTKEAKLVLLEELLKPPVKKRTAAFSRVFQVADEAPNAAEEEKLALLNSALDPTHSLGKIFHTASGSLAPDARRVNSSLWRLTEARDELKRKLHPEPSAELSGASGTNDPRSVELSAIKPK